MTLASRRARSYRADHEAPFFEKYLKDRPGFDLNDTASFRTGVEPVGTVRGVAAGGGLSRRRGCIWSRARCLSFAAPAGAMTCRRRAYVADPADPVPYRHRPIQSTYGQGSTWWTWLVEDQRFVSGRKDLANFQTPVLTSDVTVTGDVVADLFGATTGSDADWMVKLIDVYPPDAEG